MNIEEIKRELEKLDTNDLEQLIQYIKDKKLLNDFTTILVDAIELKFHDLVYCPKCGSYHIIKDGHYKNGLQRYYCHGCCSPFSPYTSTILENTKLHPIVWLKYMIAMSEGKSIRACGGYAGVSVKGSFFMRHKIMNAMVHEMDKVRLTGIVELDEMSVNISFSGNFRKQSYDIEHNAPRKSYERGRRELKHKHESEITDAIQIASAFDRSGNIFIKVAEVGTTTLSSQKIISVYEEPLQKAKAICTDGLFAYRELAKKLKIEHHAFAKESKEKRGIYHINHINYLHSVVNDYLFRHHGISSKYLNEYLAYIAYKVRHKLNDIHTYFKDVFQYRCDFRRKNYIGTGYITDSLTLG